MSARKRPRSGQDRAAATNTTSNSNAVESLSPRPLDQKHCDELHASGLSDETIAAAGIYSASGQAITDLLGWKPKETHWSQCVVIPYPGAKPQYCRVKPDYPRIADDGKPIKYESPRKQGNRAYFSPGFSKDIHSAERILIVEGEKKTLAAWQSGFRVIGIAGVWAWQQRRKRDDHGKAYGGRKLIPDLANIDWKDRQVTIVFDSDTAENDKVELAQARLAEGLTTAGASVSVATIPPAGDQKVGLDDYLVTHGVNKLRELINSATKPEMPKSSGVYELALSLVNDEFRSAVGGLSLRWHRDVFWCWSVNRYVEYPDSSLRAVVLEWMHKGGLKARPRTAREIVECLASICRVPPDVQMPRFLDGDSGLSPRHTVACSNGLLRIADLDKVELLPHRTTWFSTAVLPFPFDATAKCPQWQAFLAQVFEDDAERIALLQEWYGLCLIADTSYQKLLLMVGPKRSGKGTVSRILQHVVGEDQCTSPTLSSLGDTFGLWPLVDKYIAILADAHLGRGADAVRIMEIIKTITGEDPVNINRKNLPYLKNVRLGVRFTISVNELPHFHDASGAFSSRLLVLPFHKSFAGEEDRELEGKLKAEASGLILWALAGLRRLRANRRFTEPKAGQELLENYARITSPISAFLDECCDIDPAQQVMTDYAYAAWCAWCKQDGHAISSAATFGEKLRAANSRIVRHRLRGDGSVRSYFYVGMKLNDEGATLAASWESATHGRMGNT